MGGGSPSPFLLPALAGGYETKERGILPDATCVRQAAQVQVAPCVAGSHCPLITATPTHPNSRGASLCAYPVRSAHRRVDAGNEPGVERTALCRRKAFA